MRTPTNTVSSRTGDPEDVASENAERYLDDRDRDSEFDAGHRRQEHKRREDGRRREGVHA